MLSIFGRCTMKRMCTAAALAVFASAAGAQQDAPRVELAPGDTVTLSFFARPDISGTVRVRSDGTIAIHRIGDVTAAHLTEAELQSVLRELAIEVFGGETSVTVEAVALRPIYVIGDVTAQGAYDYRPGLTALQAFALAGGTPTAADDTGIMLRLETERQNVLTRRVRLGQLEDEIARLRAEEAALDSSAPAVDSGLEEMHAALLELREASLAMQTARTETSRELALAEGKLLEERLVILDEQGRLLQSALTRALELQERGLAAADRVESSQQSLSALQATVLDAQSDAASNQRLAASLGYERVQLRLQQQLDVHRQLLESMREAAMVEAHLRASEEFLRRFGAVVPLGDGTEGGALPRHFAVTRSLGGGRSETRDVDAATALLPGDTLHVRIAPTTENGQ